MAVAATTATIIAASVAAGASTGAGIYAANKQTGAAKDAAKTQSDAATASAKLQTDAANHAADLQSKSAADALQFSRQNSQLSLDQYNQQQSRLQPYRNLGNFALGQPNEAGPSPLSLPTLPGQPQKAATLASGATSQSGGSDPSAYTLSLIQGGMTPQQAAQQTNQKFNLQTGSQAVYYPDTNTIGLPSAYLAGPTNKPDSPTAWNIVQRAGGGGSSTPSTAGPVTLGFKPTATPLMPQTPLTPALRPPQLQYRPLGQMGVL